MTEQFTKAERKATSANQGIDFVLVTALEEERDAVLDILPGYRKLPPLEDDIRTYFQAELPVTFPDGKTGTYQVIVMPLLGMGRIQAAAATKDAITRWHPRYIVLVGIAGGLATQGVSIGDILIADQIVDYELQKLTPHGPQVRWEVQPANPRLMGACRNFMGESWQELVRLERPEQGKPQRHIGPIASGDKVIAFGEVLERYRAVWPKLIGVEMEAAGVATTAFQSSVPPGFLMVRCVSDLADEHKGSVDVEKWRAYACNAAASFAIALLKSGPVPLSSENATNMEPLLGSRRAEQLQFDLEERRYYIHAAETHLKLGGLDNLGNAIKAYSCAIELKPTVDVLFARGKVYEHQMKRREKGEGPILECTDILIVESAKLALKDFEDVIKLTDSVDIAKEARLARLRILADRFYELDEFDNKNLEWLKANTEGREHGEVLSLEWWLYDCISGWVSEEPTEALKAVDEAIRLGYDDDPRTFWLRSMANFALCNYGLALQDIDTAISKISSYKDTTVDTAEYLLFKIDILSNMKHYDEIYRVIPQARRVATREITGTRYYGNIGMDAVSYLISNSIDYHLGALSKTEIAELRPTFQAMMLGQAIRDGWVAHELLTEETLLAIRKIVGEEFWKVNVVSHLPNSTYRRKLSP